MKGYAIQGGFGIQNLTLTDFPEIEPEEKEVKVKIKAVSLNFRDYLTIKGDYNPNYKLPLVPCSDMAGEVVAIGKNCKKWKIGDRVVANFAQDWICGIPTLEQLRKSTLGGPLPGTLVEIRNFPESGLAKIPDCMSYEEASTIPCAGVTAWSSLVKEGKCKAGQSVLILGTGGVSIFALQIAKVHGLQTIITSSSNEKLERAKELGADMTINYMEKPNWSKEVRKLTNMEGVDHVIEVGGAGTIEHSIKSVKMFGHISLVGILAGRNTPIDLAAIFMQNIKMQGVIVGSRADLEELNSAMNINKIKPVVDKVFDFSETKEAIQYLIDGKHFGKIVIKVS